MKELDENINYLSDDAEDLETIIDNPKIQALGVEHAFDPSVDFNEPIEPPLSPALQNDVNQKDVNEKDKNKNTLKDIIEEYPDFLKVQKLKESKVQDESFGFIEGQLLGLAVGAERGSIAAQLLDEGLQKSLTMNTSNVKDPNFDATRDDLVSSYASINEKYWPVLLAQPNEERWQAQYKQMTHENDITKLHDKLHWWQLMPGYIAGGVVDMWASAGTINPGTKFLGATMFKTLAVNAPKTAGKLALYEFGVQGTQLLTRDQFELEEAAMNVFVAGLFGAGLGAAGGAFGFNSIDNFKSLISQQLKGAEVKFDLTEKGAIKGFVSMDDSAGAMKVTNYDFKDFAVAGFTSKEGDAFYWNPIKPIMQTATKGAVNFVATVGGNPVLKGLLSASESTRKFTGLMLRPNFEINGVVLDGKTRPKSLDESIKARKAKFFDYEDVINQGWSKYLGIDTTNKSAARISAEETIAKIKHDGLSHDDWNTELTRSLSNNGESDNASVRETALNIINLMNPIFDELRQAGMPIPEKPRFDKSYLNRVYDLDWMMRNPEEAMAALNTGFKENQDLAIELLKPITEQQAIVALKKLKVEESIDEGLKAAALEELKQAKNTLNISEMALSDRILKGEIDDFLLIGESRMNYDELAELKSLRDPIIRLSKNIKTLEKDIKALTRKSEKEIKTEGSQVLETRHKDVLENVKNYQVELKYKNKLLDIKKKEHAQVKNKIISIEDKIFQKEKEFKIRANKSGEVTFKDKEEAGNLKADLELQMDAASFVKDEVSILGKEVSEVAHNLNKYKKDLDTLERKTNKTLSKEAKELGVKDQSTVKKIAMQKQLDEQIKEIERLRKDVEIRAANDPVFKSRLTYETRNGKVRLAKPDKGTRIVRPIQTLHEIEEASIKTYNNLMGLSADQIDASVTSSAKAGSGGANMMAPRVLGFSEDQLLKMKLIHPDPKVRLNGWYNRAVKFIETQKLHNEIKFKEGDEDLKQFISKGINTDYTNLRMELIDKYADIKKNKTPKQIEKIKRKQEKESVNLFNAEKRDIKVITAIYNRVLGPGPSRDGLGNDFLRATNKMMDASFLGATSLLQIQELISPALTKGWKAQVVGSLAPFIGNFLIPWSKNNALARKATRDVGKAIQMQMYFHSRDSNFNGKSMPKSFKIPFTNWSIEAGIDRVAKLMKIWSLSDPIASMVETISTMSTHYAVANALRRNAKGKLSKKGLNYLNQMGIDPNNEIGRSILNQINTHGYKKGGYEMVNTHLWTDLAAKREFDTAVFGDVSATIFNGPDANSWPVYAGDPRGIMRYMLKYMGWGFSAMSNVLIPVMQSTGRGDFERLTVLAGMVSLSAMVDPLRKAARGEEPDLDPMTLLYGGIINSGFLGPISDMVGRVSYMSGAGSKAPGDRFRYSRGLITSAPETMTWAVVQVLGMVLAGDPNRKDIQSAIKLFFPYADVIWLRYLENEILKNQNLNKGRTKTIKENISNLF